jgi:hypothetical protein
MATWVNLQRTMLTAKGQSQMVTNYLIALTEHSCGDKIIKMGNRSKVANWEGGDCVSNCSGGPTNLARC